MNKWPPFCCVSAFFYNGLKTLRTPSPGSESDLARLLGTRVPPGVRNPFGLLEVENGEDTGVRPQNAAEVINRALSATPFRFRHIPLRTIQMEMYVDVASFALDLGAVVGIGIDARILSTATPGHRHVLKIETIYDDLAGVFDDAGETRPPPIPWLELEMNSLSINDGLWIIGRKVDLSLPYCLPWDGGGQNGAVCCQTENRK
ncbi:MAG: hypothetical protein HQL38_00840 [Alphaproteobacteria bacterium]|nr:hypothetical protein [Alphaproteobacteria bacterium]